MGEESSSLDGHGTLPGLCRWFQRFMLQKKITNDFKLIVNKQSDTALVNSSTAIVHIIYHGSRENTLLSQN